MLRMCIPWLIILPLMCLWKITDRKRKEELPLMDKNDTCILRGLGAWFVMAAHFTSWIDVVVGGG